MPKLQLKSLLSELKLYIYMLKLIGTFISLSLILVIFLRIPQNDAGLASFATNSGLLGSPGSAQRFLNILTGIGIFLYLLIALQLNLETV